MKIRASLLLFLTLSSSLAGCGGYPMTVESRAPLSAEDAQLAQQDQVLTQHQRLARGRGAY